MNISRPILAGAALLALALPVALVAHASPAAPATTPATESRHHGGGLNHRAMQGITLSSTQTQQLEQLRTAYRTAHPKGSTPDPAARKALREQMLNVLTAEQRSQYEANVKQLRTEQAGMGSGPFAPSPSPSPVV